MRRGVRIVVLIVVAQTHAKQHELTHKWVHQGFTDKLVNKFVDKLFQRALTASPLHDADVDSMTLRKSGNLVVPQPVAQLSPPSSLLPHYPQMSTKPTKLLQRVHVFNDARRQLQKDAMTFTRTDVLRSMGSMMMMMAPFPAVAEECAQLQNFNSNDISGKSFKGQDMRGAIFAGATVRKADLSGVNAEGSIDTFAQFDFSDLRNSRWKRALADRVTFFNADLSGADFTQAILSGSSIEGAANFEGADFTEALMDDKTRKRLCQACGDGCGVNERTGVDTRDSLLCGLKGRALSNKLDEAFDARQVILQDLMQTECTEPEEKGFKQTR